MLLKINILVTAQKRPAALAVTPVALSVLDEQALVGVRDVLDMQQLSPSLFVEQGSSSNSLRFGMRGVSTGSENLALESSVGLYVDGVYRARQGGLDRDVALKTILVGRFANEADRQRLRKANAIPD